MDYFNQLVQQVQTLITAGKIYIAFTIIAAVVIFFMCCEILSRRSRLERGINELQDTVADEIMTTAELISENEKSNNK